MPPTNLPRIACFHGGGSNAAIFEIQCSFISSLLSSTFTLEFFNGPFLRSAGPGVLPAFESCGPYRSWDGVERVLGLMEERGREKGFGAEMWVGVMGFSQGTRVAGGLLLDQQRREAGGLQKGVGEGIKIRFGVLCNGGGAPMESEAGYKIDNSDTVIRIPTLHLHGLKDEYLGNARDQLAKYYDRDTATLYEINYHHAMPWVKAESEELARLIKELYSKTRD